MLALCQFSKIKVIDLMAQSKILVIEDELMTARLITYRLKSLSHEVQHEKDGVKGLQAIK